MNRTVYFLISIFHSSHCPSELHHLLSEPSNPQSIQYHIRRMMYEYTLQKTNMLSIDRGGD
jgi:hypothetical protein